MPHHEPSLIRRGATALLFTTLAASGTAVADPPGQRGGQRQGPGVRDHEFRDRGAFGGHVRHDRVRVTQGRVHSALPLRHDVAFHNGIRFYFGGGLWYSSPRPGRFVVVTPPLGIAIPALPPVHTRVWVGPTAYYHANNTYYLPSAQGYTVVAPPTNLAAVAPQAAVAPVAPAPEAFFVYPRDGQDLKQQAADRGECNEWATGQTGYDPRFGLPASDTLADQKRSDYRRALDACLDGRGYTMK